MKTYRIKIGTSYKAAIIASYEDLVSTFGQPMKGDDVKIEAEWIIRLPNNRIATIYNYKNSRCWSDELPEITQVRGWHIGGHKSDVVDPVLAMLGDKAKLVDRAA